MNYPAGDAQPEGPQHGGPLIGGSPPGAVQPGLGPGGAPAAQPGGVQPVVVQPGVGPGGAQAGQPLIGANPGEIRRKKNRDREQPSQP